MKKIITLLIIVFIIICFTSCNKQPDNIIEENKDNKLNIITTVYSSYDFAKQVTGDLATVKMLVSPGKNSASYKPTKRDIQLIQNCDILIYIGGESDSWVSDILSSIDTKDISLISINEVVDKLISKNQIIKISDISYEKYYEHAWITPGNAMLIAFEISDKLSEIDKENADVYNANATNYAVDMIDLDNSFRDVIEKSNSNLMVFADRFTFAYFVNEYGLHYHTAFNKNSDSIKTEKDFISEVNEHGHDISFIFYNELSDHKLADSISAKTNIKTVMFRSGINITEDEFETGLSLMDLMNINLVALEKALN